MQTLLDGLTSADRVPARATARPDTRPGGAARPRPRRPRPRRHPRRAPAGARDDRPADRDLRLHDQGLRARDRRPPAEPLRAADAASRSTRFRESCGLTPENEWDGFDPETRREARCSIGRVERLDRGRRPPARRDRRAADPVGTRDPAHDLDAGGVRAHPARPLPRRRRRRAARHRGARRLRSRRTSADSSTRPASGATTRSRSTTRWRTRRSSGASARRDSTSRWGSRR